MSKNDEQGTLDSALTISRADIVIGIPSYQNVRTISHVVRAIHAGLVKYFPQYTAVVVNSDGGSTDGTRDAVLSTRVEDTHLLLLSHPLFPIHRLSMPYHGIPGKGSAFRLIFQVADRLHAKACAVVDSDLRSITPEWVDLLVRPVLNAGFDFVAPYYHRHKYDGTITNSIVYPMTRALYGLRVRQPIGGDFGISNHLVARYLERNDWESDVARYGIDIWMTTIAITEGFRICQSFLGAKLHDAKDPGSDLSAMLQQVVGSVFRLMEEYDRVWQTRQGSRDVDLFGFRFDVGLDPIDVNVERMLGMFSRACSDLRELWSIAMHPDTFREVIALSATATREQFRLSDELWVRIVYDFACAHKRHLLERGHLLRSLTPLYLARVASFVLETQTLFSAEVEEKIENLCRVYEEMKPYLVANWTDTAPGVTEPAPAATAQSGETSHAVDVATNY